MITNIVLFFTAWIFLLDIFHLYTHQYFDLVYLNLLVISIGSIISFIYPRKYTIVIQDKKYIFDGFTKLFSIDLLHVMMFILIILKYGSTKFTYPKFIASILLLCLYMILLDPKHIYGISYIEMLSLTTIVTILYYYKTNG